MTDRQEIPGYSYGQTAARSPLSMEDLQRLQGAVMLTEEDRQYLRLAGDVLADQVEQVLDVWYAFIGERDYLLYYFCTPDGEPDPHYLQAVRRRFGQWIIDTCRRPYDQDWLDYQYEIALRHHRSKKNVTDRVHAADIISLRYVIALAYPIISTIRPFLAHKGHGAEEVERMAQAWAKAVILQVALWSYPYVRPEDY